MQRNADLFGVRPRIWGIVALGVTFAYVAGKRGYEPQSRVSHQLSGEDVAAPMVAASKTTRSEVKAPIPIRYSSTNAAKIIHDISDPDANIRLQALRQLQALRSHPQDVLPILIACLNDPDASVRAEAALCLGAHRMAANDAVPALKQLAFNDTNDLVRSRAKDALYNIRFYDFGPNDF